MEKRHFYEKENAGTKLLLHRTEGCTGFYVDTANNGFLLHVLSYHLDMWLSILQLVFWEVGAQEGGRCNTAPCVHPPRDRQGRPGL